MVICCLLDDVLVVCFQTNKEMVSFVHDGQLTKEKNWDIIGMISDELRTLLEYFEDPEQIPDTEKTELVKKLDGIVDYANHDADWRRKHMTYEMLQMDAEKKGRIEGAITTLISLVKDGLLDIKDACKRANMTEQEFKAHLFDK